MKIRLQDERSTDKLRLRLRIDYRGEEQSGRFFFGGKSSEATAEETRENQMGLLKNVPRQGIIFEEFDAGLDIYLLEEGDGRRKQEVAYAPLLVTVQANHLEDVFPLLLLEGLKQVEVLGPERLTIERNDLERLYYHIAKNFGRAWQKNDAGF